MLSTSIKNVKSTKGNNLFWDEGRISFFVSLCFFSMPSTTVLSFIQFS